MRVKDAVGRFGEQVAAEHLSGAGATIVARNWRCREGEIDLVVLDGTTLVIVEVKTRSSLAFGSPAEAVDRRKTVRLRRLAALWIQEQRGEHANASWSAVRFDVVSVVRRPRGAAHIDHVIGAF